ncbi:MAG: hypothetical protein E7216_03825 [Clostridium thermopalmarium]|uniref:hypothetical protein n=1 Tax=Clostridium thermopalmarium TaxID=29373 RepID=UPI0023528760|nr:hypothetical protein [Clostridium thermopalmarium]MBE6043359.1 hypothetical protein [Clostridium thermopalmarium]
MNKFRMSLSKFFIDILYDSALIELIEKNIHLLSKFFVDILCGFALIELIERKIRLHGFKLTSLTKYIISTTSVIVSGIIFGLIFVIIY